MPPAHALGRALTSMASEADQLRASLKEHREPPFPPYYEMALHVAVYVPTLVDLVRKAQERIAELEELWRDAAGEADHA